MPIIQGGIVGTTWGTWRRKAVSIAGLIAAVTGAIVGIAKATPVVEPWWYASRGYVRDVGAENESRIKIAQSKIEKKLDHIQLEQAQGKAEAADNDLFKAGLEYKKAADDQTKEYIQQQINKLTATKERIKSQIETLRKGSQSD